MLQQTDQIIWNSIIDQYQINNLQQKQFESYLELLLEENTKYNLTAIKNVTDVLQDHFLDSIAITKLYDFAKVDQIIDVGSGAGFPGLALAVMFPMIPVCLIEVNLKKVNFLKLAIETLALKNVTICSDDWRTFLRSELAVNVSSRNVLVTARASLPVEELCRVLRPSSAIKHATFVYWASKKWVPTEQEKEYLDSCLSYQVGQKERQLCFFNAK